MKRIIHFSVILLTAALCLAACTSVPGDSLLLPSDKAETEKNVAAAITESTDNGEKDKKESDIETGTETENVTVTAPEDNTEVETEGETEPVDKSVPEAAPEGEGVGVVTVSFSGSFTATVEKLLPDYCALPGNTIAVVHFFQSMPFLLRFEEDMTGKLREGTSYVFDFEPFEVLMPETETAPAIEDYMYRIRITTFREATMDEVGMGSLLPEVAG